MKNLILFLGILCLVSCGGSLSDDQRKKLKEGMDTHKVVRVTDSEIVSASLDRGKNHIQGVGEHQVQQFEN